MRTALVLAVGSLALFGCDGYNDDPIEIPAGALVYIIEPSLIGYEFDDTSGGRDFHLDWMFAIPEFPFTGRTCFGISPSAATDTIGSFVFRAVGPNEGYVLVRDGAVTDTGLAFFLPPAGSDAGTRGNYLLRSSGQLELSWADGLQSRYFDPAAVLRVSGDSIISDADLSERGDSVRTKWHVVWTRGQSC